MFQYWWFIVSLPFVSKYSFLLAIYQVNIHFRAKTKNVIPQKEKKKLSTIIPQKEHDWK